MDIKGQVLDFIRISGPVLPVDVSKKLNSDIIYAGAVLSDLVSNKLIKISAAKIGGSPVYYVSGQEERLGRLYNYLPAKEKEAYNLLKEKKILKDRDCEPGIRVALRQLKDFAFPFMDKNEVLWKWYLVKDEEVQNILNPAPKVEEKPVEIKIEEKKPELKQEIKPEVKEKKIRKPREKKIKDERNLLLDEINSYLNSKKIKLLENLEIKKNEISLKIELDSELGKLKYLLCAKDKKSISDNDLTLAYNKGQQHKLPVLFLSTSGLSKKAEKYLESISGFLVFKKL